MLVLTRRVGESVVIGDDVVVTVLDVKGDVVRVGVQAPREVRVHRAEVYAAVREANQAAARTRGADLEELRRLAAQRSTRRPRRAGRGSRAAADPTGQPDEPPSPESAPPREPVPAPESAPDEPLQREPRQE